MEEKKRHKIEIKDLKKDNLFTVPESYFDELPQKIQKRIFQEEEQPWYRVLLYQPAYRFAGAFSLLFLFVFGIYFYQNTESTEEDSTTALVAVSEEDIYYYLEENNYLLDAEVVQEVENEFLAYGDDFNFYLEDDLPEGVDVYEIQDIIINDLENF